MSRKGAVWLAIFAWVGLYSAGALAAGFDVTISVTASIGKEGFSLENSTVSATVATEISEIQISSTTTFSWALAFVSQVFVASGQFGDFNWMDETTISKLSLSEPISDVFTIWTKVGSWDVRSITHLKYTLDLNVFDLVGQTFQVGTTKEGLTLASATTVNFSGFTKQAFTASYSIMGLAMTQLTEIGTAGLIASTWVMSTTIEGLRLERVTVYTNEGLASDALTVSGVAKLDATDLNWSCTASFGKTGWEGLALTAAKTFPGLGAPPKTEE